MSFRCAILVFPGVQQLDLAGPYEVFASVAEARVDLIWKDLDPVVSSTGLRLKPTLSFVDCPQLDILCVPGGVGVNALLYDERVLRFIAAAARRARFVTSVCSGALLLGMAGLLAGKRATTHWNALDFLASFGAVPMRERVVTDGNLITAGGVTAGIDFGLTLIEALCGRAEAEAVQLALEYAPEPPFAAGTPDTASPETLALARTKLAASRAERERLLEWSSEPG